MTAADALPFVLTGTLLLGYVAGWFNSRTYCALKWDLRRQQDQETGAGR